MALAVRRAWLIIVLALGLLAGLLGWTMHMETAMPLHAAGTHITRQMASGPNWYCPPPPYDCWGQ